jgi:hypothetical protein
MKEAPDHTVLIASLALIAAIVAALIAAVSADIRQRRQLKHDRHMQDLAELRSVLDDATVAFEEAIYALQYAFAGLGFATAAVPAESDSATDQPSDEATVIAKAVNEKAQRIFERRRKKEYNNDMRACAIARDKMIVAGQRIAIRIGNRQALYLTQNIAIGLVIDTIRYIGAMKQREEAGVLVSGQDFEEHNGKLDAARKLFVEQAVACVGSQIPS